MNYNKLKAAVKNNNTSPLTDKEAEQIADNAIDVIINDSVLLRCVANETLIN